VTVSAAGESVQTGANGAYLLSGLPAGSFPVTPALSGFIFSPSSKPATVGPDAAGVDFAATSASAVAPTGLTAAVTGPAQVRLSFTGHAPNEDDFRVDRALAGQTFAPLTTPAPAKPGSG